MAYWALVFIFLYCIRNGAFGEENLRTLHCKQLLAVDVLDCIERLLNKNIKSLNEKKKTYDLMWNLPCLLYFCMNFISWIFIM